MNKLQVNCRYVTNTKGLIAACILSAAGALVFNSFPLFLSTIADQWRLSDEQLGLLGASYLGGFALTSLGSVFWMPRFKWKMVGFLSYLLIGVGVIGFSLPGMTWKAFAYMAILGIGSGTIFTIAIGILSRATNVDRAYGIKTAAEMLAASILIYLMTSIVIKQFGFAGFAYGSLVLYCLSAVAIMLLPSNFMKAENDAFENADERATSSKNPAGWLSVIALFIQAAAFSGLWGFMERIGGNNGVSSDTIGTILSISIIFGLGGAIMASMLGDRFGQAKPLTVAFITTLAIVLMLSFIKSTTAFAIAACAINALLQICIIYQMALITVADQTGKFTLLIAFIISTGAATGPGVFGFLKTENSFLPVYITVCCITIISLVLTNLADSMMLSQRE